MMRWTTGHRCKQGEAQLYVSNLLHKGHSDVHILSEPVQVLQNKASELHRDLALATERESDTETNVQSRQVLENLSLFDKLVNEGGSTPTHATATSSKKCLTYHLFTSFEK